MLFPIPQTVAELGPWCLTLENELIYQGPFQRILLPDYASTDSISEDALDDTMVFSDSMRTNSHRDQFRAEYTFRSPAADLIGVILLKQQANTSCLAKSWVHSSSARCTVLSWPKLYASMTNRY